MARRGAAQIDSTLKPQPKARTLNPRCSAQGSCRVERMQERDDLLRECDFQYGFRVVAPGAARPSQNLNKPVSNLGEGVALQQRVFAAESQVGDGRER